MPKYRHTSIRLPEATLVQLKIMCALTNSTIGNFIRIAIESKIKELKEGVNQKEET